MRNPRSIACLFLASVAVLPAACMEHGRFTGEALDRAEQRLAHLKASTEVDLAEQSLLAGSLAKAAKQADRAARLNPDAPRAQLVVGRVALERDDIASAREAFARAVGLEPGSAQARFYAGAVEERIGKREAALRHYRKAAELDPMDAQYALAAAEVLLDLDRHGTAHETLATSPAAEGSAGIHRLLAQIEMMGGRTDSAIAHLREARLLAPEDDAVMEDLAAAHAAAGSFRRAASLLDVLLAHPEHEGREDLRLLRARCRLVSGDPALARQDYLALTASETESTAYRAWVGLGKAAFVQQDQSALRRAASRAVSADQRAPEGYVLWALWHHRRGDLAAAVRSVRIGLEHCPGSPDLDRLGVALETERRGEGDALRMLAAIGSREEAGGPLP